jgi:putative cell wall-binding protein/peptidoglycan hydrolase-like protein with peptidoglycan-binding domain
VRAASAVVTFAVTLLLLPALPAAAHPVPHGEAPQIVNVTPAGGAVTGAGEVAISALAIGGRPIERHELHVDGELVPTRSSGGDHALIEATVQLEPGVHEALLTVGSAAGDASRRWRFHVDDLRIRRLAGDGRVETAVAISADLYREAESAQAAVLARADEFPDALAGGPLAAAVDGPLLLTGSDTLHPATAAELTRILPDGATVHLLGGPSALTAQVAADVEALGFAVRRLAGDSRYATAAAIGAGVPASPVAFVASGEGFADALAVSSPAARDGIPILLTPGDELHEATRAALSDREVEHVVIVGGAAAVSAEVERALSATVPRVERLAGLTRFETAEVVGRRFFPAAETVAVANGLRFPDALAGGRHAGAHSAPIALVDTQAAADPQVAQVERLQPDELVLYGGSAAVGGGAAGALRAGRASRGGPGLETMTPASGEVTTLDEIVVRLDRDVFLPASDVQVVVGGDEATGVLRHGEFASELVYAITSLPGAVQPRTPYAVDVTVSASDGRDARVIHRRLTLVQPPATLARGDRGPEVVDLQNRLRAAGYWLGTVDGTYGNLTHQAVMALQKAHGLERDGAYTPETRAVLESNPARPTPRSGPGSGRVYEVDLVRQILLLVVDGRVEWIINTSTGHGRVYEFNGQTYRATTTTGLDHRVVRQIDGLREAERGSLWRPKYYDTNRGIAIHGSTSVPATPESSGCIRVTYAAMDFIWSLDPGTGARVMVYPVDHYR